MAKKRDRVTVPAEIERQIRTEAGDKCSMPRCDVKNGLRVHYIDEDPGNNDPANLLLLCPNCHSFAARRMDADACRAIKQTLQLRAASESELESAKAEVVSRIEQFVDRQTEPEYLLEEEMDELETSVEIGAAAEQAVIFAEAGVGLPVDLVRGLVYELFWSEDLEQALALQSFVATSDSAEAVDHLNLGLLFDSLNKDDEAEQAYKKAVETDPTLVQGWHNLGILASDRGRNDEAEQAYKKAVELDPTLARAWSNLGSLLMGLDRNDEAEQAYRKAVDIEPDDARAWANLAVLLSGLGRKDEAEQAFRSSLEVVPDDADVHNNLAYLLWELGRFDEAETETKQALELDPKHCYANATLGLILFEKDDLRGGRRRYEKAMEVEPRNLDLQRKYHFEYGRALAKKQRPDDARTEFIKAKRIDSTLVPVADIDAELKKLDEQG